MKNSHHVLTALLLASAFVWSARCQETKPLPTENFYTKSLHFTNRGKP